jgi:hypothetical protein
LSRVKPCALVARLCPRVVGVQSLLPVARQRQDRPPRLQGFSPHANPLQITSCLRL